MIPVSWLSRWKYCPRQVFLEAVKGIRAVENAQMVKGSLAHAILARVFRKHDAALLATKDGMGREGFVNLFSDAYMDAAQDAILFKAIKLKRFSISPTGQFEEYVGLLKQLAARHAEEAFALASTLSLYGKPLAEALFPKYQAGVFVESEALGLRGEIDLLEVYKDTRVAVELKTSSPPDRGVWDSDQMQLAAYEMILGEQKGFVDYLKFSKRIPVVLNQFLEDEVKGVRDEIEGMLRTGKEPILPEANEKCRACSHRKTCWS